MKKQLQAILLVILLTVMAAVSGCGTPTGSDADSQRTSETAQEIPAEQEKTKDQDSSDGAGNVVDLSSIPDYAGNPYIPLNGNVPEFSEEDLTTTSFESYSSLDSLGRCGVCVANIGQDLMPTEEREGIGAVKPTGWHTVKYNGVVDGNYLYNRCHLIGYQLSGENANEKNLITGTRYMNVEGMLPFENMVADYVKETGNHVFYRVTPMFAGDNLLASGVTIEAQSVEDQGEGIQFYVYCYNVQPGIAIDYTDGNSHLEETNASEETSGTEQAGSHAEAYAVNPRNGKIHQTGKCPATGSGSGAMSNPKYFASYEEAEAYSKQTAPDLEQRQCGNCW